MPRRYAVGFRRKVLDLIEAGNPVAEIAVQLGVSDQTIYNWRNEDRVHQGLRAAMSTAPTRGSRRRWVNRPGFSGGVSDQGNPSSAIIESRVGVGVLVGGW